MSFSDLNQRSAKSKMLLVLSLGSSVCMLLFAIYRIIAKDWYIALLDSSIAVGMGFIFLYVYKTDNTKNASIVLILLALVGNVISFYLNGISQVSWIYPAMLSAYYIMSPMKGMFINIVMLMFYIPKLVTTLAVIDVVTIISTIVFTNLIAFVFASGLRAQAKVLKELASVDYLTKTGNRRALDQKLQNLHKILKNHDKTASLILLDLDHFKNINDTFGHIKGDEVLVALSQLLMNCYEEYGKVFRYGGEEFLVVCPDKNIIETSKVSEKLRVSVKEQIKVSGHSLSISIGVAEYLKEESIAEWIHRVDLALYQAKKEGRDRLIKA